MKKLLIPVIAIAVAALVLLGASFGLRSIAVDNARQEHLKTMQTLLPGSESFTVEPYTGEDENILSVHKGEGGFVVETQTRGYADDIRIWIGVSNEGTVTGIQIREMHETMGLGQTALTDADLLAQFLRSDGSLTVGEGVDAITGATVTSKAVARCVTSAVAYVTGADVDSGATSWGG
jgi:electron transport complex protein RnfG